MVAGHHLQILLSLEVTCILHFHLCMYVEGKAFKLHLIVHNYVGGSHVTCNFKQ